MIRHLVACSIRLTVREGLDLVDGSMMPANPGINPTLTIAALAEYAMEQIPPKQGASLRKPLMKP